MCQNYKGDELKAFIEGMDFMHNCMWHDDKGMPEFDSRILVENKAGGLSLLLFDKCMTINGDLYFYGHNGVTVIKTDVLRWLYIQDLTNDKK